MVRPRKIGKVANSSKTRLWPKAEDLRNMSGQEGEIKLPLIPMESSPTADKHDVTLQLVKEKEEIALSSSSESFWNKHRQGKGVWISRRRDMIILLLLTIPVVAAYANSLSVPFYLDDSDSITLNQRIKLTEISWDSITNLDFKSPRPVAYFSFALNYYFHQYELAWYHIVNVLVHLLSGIFLFLLASETLRLAFPQRDERSVTTVAFWAALFWLINPLCTSAVTYVVQRMTSMAAMFYVLALYLYVRGRLALGIRRWCCFAATILAWLLALGTKQIAVTLPFFILIYEALFLQKFARAWFVRNLKYFAVAIVLVVGLALLFLGMAPLKTYWAAYKYFDYTPAQRFFTEFRVVVRYVSLLFFPYPDRLVFYYNYPLSNGFFDPISTIISMVTILGLLGGAFYLVSKQPIFSFAVFWYLGNLLPETVWPTSIIFEHKAYLPTMFLFLPICDWSIRFVDWKRLSVVGLLIVALFGLWTYQRNNLWQDPVAFWQQSINKYPTGTAAMYSALGNELFKQGKFAEAIPNFKEALRLNPHYSDAYNNLGSCLARAGNYAEAIEYFQKAVARNPANVYALANLGLAYRDSGDIEKAIIYFRKTVLLDPNNELAKGWLQSAISYSEGLKSRTGGINR